MSDGYIWIAMDSPGYHIGDAKVAGAKPPGALLYDDFYRAGLILS